MPEEPLTISQVIQHLKDVMDKEGDLPVYTVASQDNPLVSESFQVYYGTATEPDYHWLAILA